MINYTKYARVKPPEQLRDEARRERVIREKQDHAAMIQRAVSVPPGWIFQRDPQDGKWGWIAPLTAEDRARRSAVRRFLVQTGQAKRLIHRLAPETKGEA